MHIWLPILLDRRQGTARLISLVLSLVRPSVRVVCFELVRPADRGYGGEAPNTSSFVHVEDRLRLPPQTGIPPLERRKCWGGHIFVSYSHTLSIRPSVPSIYPLIRSAVWNDPSSFAVDSFHLTSLHHPGSRFASDGEGKARCSRREKTARIGVSSAPSNPVATRTLIMAVREYLESKVLRRSRCEP